MSRPDAAFASDRSRPSTLTDVLKPAGYISSAGGAKRIVDAEIFERFAVSVERARIFFEIFGWSKLFRVHENRNDDRRALLLRCAHQRKMAFMQRAHGRNEAE